MLLSKMISGNIPRQNEETTVKNGSILLYCLTIVNAIPQKSVTVTDSNGPYDTSFPQMGKTTINLLPSLGDIFQRHNFVNLRQPARLSTFRLKILAFILVFCH